MHAAHAVDPGVESSGTSSGMARDEKNWLLLMDQSTVTRVCSPAVVGARLCLRRASRVESPSLGSLGYGKARRGLVGS